MKTFLFLCCAVMVSMTGSSFAADAPLGGMQLLPGYVHNPLQGIDSVVGEIKKEGGLRIMYEIGAVIPPGQPRFGGSFSDRPKMTPKQSVRWYREQMVNGQPVHIAYLKNDSLLASYPQKGINFHVQVKTTEELADALLMILTYPKPTEKAPKAKTPKPAK